LIIRFNEPRLDYKDVLPAALAFAQRALAAAAILARADATILRRFIFGLLEAHANMTCFLGRPGFLLGATGELESRSEANSFSNSTIFSLRSAAYLAVPESTIAGR
jgi:hypothetical protein